jgi:hypothetical protein
MRQCHAGLAAVWKASEEGETVGPLPGLLVASLLPITLILDDVSDDRRELTKMVFHRTAGLATGG